MHAAIKTRAAFRTAYSRQVLDYSLVLDAIEDLGSTLRLMGGDIPQSAAGGFLSVAGTLFLIASVSPGQGQTDLALLSPLDLFTRPRPYVPPGDAASIGSFVARELAEGWRDEPDAVYAMPYLRIENSDTTAFVPPETDDNGWYVLADYLRTVRRDYGVELLFLPDMDTLSVQILPVQPAAHVLLAGDGHTFLKENTYSRTAVSKVTTVQPVDSGTVDANGEKIFNVTPVNWYLAADGSVSSQEPQGRAFGDWQVITVSEKNDAEEAARAVFSRNVETHKVEFYTDFRPRARDSFRLRLPSGNLFEGEIFSVSRTRGDRRWLCQAGSLAVSLTDKVRKAGGSSGSSRGSSGGSRSRSGSGAGAGEIYAIGDIYITTRAGDPADLLGYGAWDRIRGRFLFAADEAHPVNSRGGASSHTIQPEELPSGTNILDPANLYLATDNAGSGSILRLNSLTGSLAVKELGADQPFSLLPPFMAVYVWIRKA